MLRSPVGKHISLPVPAGIATKGNTWYVSNRSGDGGSNGNHGASPDKPWSTLAYAETRVAVGDTVVVLPGHNETIATALSWDTANTSIVGLKAGNLRPIITPNGAIDAITLAAAGILIQGIEFAIPGTDAQTADINVTGADCAIVDTLHHGSTTAKNKTDIVTVAATAHDLLISGMKAYNDTVDCVSAISLEGVAARVIVENCFLTGQYSTAVIMDEAAAVMALIRNNIFHNTKAATAVANFTNDSTGVCSQNFMAGRHTTIASNVVPGTGMNFHENYVVEEAALNGLYIPAQDAD